MDFKQLIKSASLFFFFISFNYNSFSQKKYNYWNTNTQLINWRFVNQISNIKYSDLDNDGDPDVLYSTINDKISIAWIDDDDDMKYGDKEGDTDNDCLLIDRNNDNIFAGPFDFSIDWSDEDSDGIADIQLIVNNGGNKIRSYYDWSADYMYVFDDDKDGIMHFVDWNVILMKAWDHNGCCNFFEDYHGNSTFLKMHASSFRISDLRFNWENPFIFYDVDHDGYTEMAIRLVDTPIFRDSATASKFIFQNIDSNYDISFTKKIDYAAITWDLDNDNGPSNEFDFDMSLLFKGNGFSYEDQFHTFQKLKGLQPANSIMYDSRWREIDTLFFPDRNNALDLITTKGKWKECRLVFDEDDDCNRWERVEFYDPKDLYKIGTENGGLDHNKQSDAIGDRGEFDQDFSGKGSLYIGKFDGKLHLFGAEWGAWRIDQTAFSYQGFGGQYGRWGKNRLQIEPTKFALIKYEDTDNNGFIDFIKYDLDGDQSFEDSVSLITLGILDTHDLITTESLEFNKISKTFESQVNKNWGKAIEIKAIAEKYGINTNWYNFYLHPNSINQKYDFSFWLSFYLFRDLLDQSKLNKDIVLENKILYAYYSGDWSKLKL